MKKSEYWEPTLEDSLDCVAKSFTIAARIYRNIYLNGPAEMAPLQKDKDLSWNFANQIGFGDSAGFVDVIRLYNALHSMSLLLLRCIVADSSPRLQLITRVETFPLTLLVRSSSRYVRAVSDA